MRLRLLLLIFEKPSSVSKKINTIFTKSPTIINQIIYLVIGIESIFTN